MRQLIKGEILFSKYWRGWGRIKVLNPEVDQDGDIWCLVLLEDGRTYKDFYRECQLQNMSVENFTPNEDD